MAEEEHAIYGGSSYKRWKNCPGSIALSKTVPKLPSGPSAREGTRAHALAEYCLVNGIWDAREVLAMDQSQIALKNQHAPWTDPKMARGVNLYLDVVHSSLSAYPDAMHLIESRVYPTDKHRAECFGTTDWSMYAPSERFLRVVDFKYGVQPVDPEENDQELFYAAGLWRSAQAAGGAYPIDKVELVIVQPNLLTDDSDECVKRWTTTGERLSKVPGEIDAAIDRCKAEPHVFKAGDHCMFCPAQAICHAYRQRALDDMRVEFSDLLNPDFNLMEAQPVAEMTLDEIARLYRAADGIRAWLKQIEDLAFKHAVSGRTVPGYKLVRKTGTRKWIGDEQHVAAALTMIYGLDEDTVRPRELASITEVEAALKAALLTPQEFKAAKEFITAELMLKEASGIKLVPESERGDAVSPPDAAAIYADLLN